MIGRRWKSLLAGIGASVTFGAIAYSVGSGPAEASFPGATGKLAFVMDQVGNFDDRAWGIDGRVSDPSA